MSIGQLRPETMRLNKILSAVNLKDRPGGIERYSQVRDYFLELPFHRQAAYIAEYAKGTLDQSNKYIADMRKITHSDIPSAERIWSERVMERVGKIPTRWEWSPDSEPKLECYIPMEISEMASSLIQKYYSCSLFWVDNFYSASANGERTFESVRFSVPIGFTRTEMDHIDIMSGMKHLGSNIVGYAQFLDGSQSGGSYLVLHRKFIPGIDAHESYRK